MSRKEPRPTVSRARGTDSWERAGEPERGPVFPARVGKRAGQAKRPANSYADRLRRDLFRAGVCRLPPVQVPAPKPGQRTDLGKAAGGTKLAADPRDPLYFETATTLPVDFHSFRRAFNTALAEAGVNVQHAMHLASHADAKVHSRYVMSTRAMRTVPNAALPRLPLGVLREAWDRGPIVTDRDDSRRPPPPGSAQLRGIVVGAIGIEPTTPTVSTRPDGTQTQALRALATRRTARATLVTPLVSPCRRMIRPNRHRFSWRRRPVSLPMSKRSWIGGWRRIRHQASRHPRPARPPYPTMAHRRHGVRPKGHPRALRNRSGSRTPRNPRATSCATWSVRSSPRRLRAGTRRRSCWPTEQVGPRREILVDRRACLRDSVREVAPEIHRPSAARVLRVAARSRRGG
jgi:hypothetical protein